MGRESWCLPYAGFFTCVTSTKSAIPSDIIWDDVETNFVIARLLKIESNLDKYQHCVVCFLYPFWGFIIWFFIWNKKHNQFWSQTQSVYTALQMIFFFQICFCVLVLHTPSVTDGGPTERYYDSLKHFFLNARNNNQFVL